MCTSRAWGCSFAILFPPLNPGRFTKAETFELVTSQIQRSAPEFRDHIVDWTASPPNGCGSPQPKQRQRRHLRRSQRPTAAARPSPPIPRPLLHWTARRVPVLIVSSTRGRCALHGRNERGTTGAERSQIGNNTLPHNGKSVGGIAAQHKGAPM